MANAPQVAPVPEDAPPIPDLLQAKVAALGPGVQRVGVLSKNCALPQVERDLLNARFAAFAVQADVKKKKGGAVQVEQVVVRLCLTCGWPSRSHSASRMLSHLIPAFAPPGDDIPGGAQKVIKAVRQKGDRTTYCTDPLGDDALIVLAKAGVQVALAAVRIKFGDDAAKALESAGTASACGSWAPQWTKEHNRRLQRLHVVLVTVMFGTFNSMSCDVVRYILKEFTNGQYQAPGKDTAMRLFRELVKDTMEKVGVWLKNPAEPVAITFDGATGTNGEQFHNVCATTTSSSTGLNTKFVLDVKEFAWEAKTAERLADHVWTCIEPFARNVCSTAPDTAAPCMKAQRVLHELHGPELQRCADLPCTTHVGNLLVKDAREAWGADHGVALRDGRRVAFFWNKCKRAKCLLSRTMEVSKKSGALKRVMKIRSARATRFCSIQRMLQSVLHNRGIIKNLIWDQDRGARRPAFAALVNPKTEPRAKKMLSVILSTTSMNGIAWHEKILRPITEYARKQDQDGVQIHMSALRWYVCRVAVAKELGKVSQESRDAWEQTTLARTKGAHGAVPVLSAAAKVAFLLHPPHRSKAREHEVSAPPAGEIKLNILWQICASAMGPFLQQFFDPADSKAAWKEWIEYQNMTGVFGAADLSMVQDSNPLFFWVVNAWGSIYLAKVAAWVYRMREQNTPSEHANALMGRVSQPIRNRLRPATKRGCLLLAANCRTVNAPDIPMLRAADEQVRKKLAAKLEKEGSNGDEVDDGASSSSGDEVLTESDAPLDEDAEPQEVDASLEAGEGSGDEAADSDFEGFGDSDDAGGMSVLD